MGNTRNLFKKIGDIMGTYYERMGTIKERNCKDLTQAEEIKKMCRNTWKNYSKWS